MGIAAFSIGGSFGSAINSMLPVAAGGAVTTEKKEDEDDTAWGTKAEDAIKDVVTVIGGEL